MIHTARQRDGNRRSVGDALQIGDLTRSQVVARIGIKLQRLDFVQRKVLELQRATDNLCVITPVFGEEAQTTVPFTRHAQNLGTRIWDHDREAGCIAVDLERKANTLQYGFAGFEGVAEDVVGMREDSRV